MLENTATYGSLETSDYEKRALARSSLAYNLKSKTFRDLFPDFCQKPEPTPDAANAKATTTSQQQKCDTGLIHRRAATEQNGAAMAATDDGNGENQEAIFQDTNNDGGAGGGLLNASALSNLLVFVGIIAFVFIAKYVLQSAE